MKKLAFALALVALFCFNVSAQDCGGSKKGCDGGTCTGTATGKQAEAKLTSKPQDEKKAPKTDEVIKRGACHGSLSSGCDQLDSYLSLEKAANAGCETSKAKLAALTKDNPKLPEIAQLYKNACNGCEKSAAKLAALRKEMKPQEEPKAKKSDCCGDAKSADCCGDAAKTVKATDAKSACDSCQDEKGKVAKAKSSGCEKLDAYLAAEGAAAKGCETSKAKLAALTKENPKLPEMAQLYKNACNGCEKSAAKLAEMRKAAQKPECKDCEVGTKAAKMTKSDCEGTCGDACGDACESGAKVVKKAENKADCQGSCGDCGDACESGAKVAKAPTGACGMTAEMAKAGKGSGCEKLDAYLAAEGAAAKGCETSKAKLAALTKENPKLPEMAQLYKNACNGCEKSAAKLAEMRKAAQKPECKDCEVGTKAAKMTKSDCEGTCGDACGDACESGAKVISKAEAKKGSGCEKLDAYLAAEGAAAKGCETSKAKLAALTKENPKLPEMAQLYKNACNGCEKSAAKLAEMRKAAQQQKADCGSCEGKMIEKKADAKKSDCGSDCGSSCDGCENAKTIGVQKSGEVHKADCCPATERKTEPKSGMKDL
ncbi:MAG: hypothetical protein H6807_16345 [Planctomycetes bacterium]|nr:hypothetical protein [Planctomycetota bacterium]